MIQLIDMTKEELKLLIVKTINESTGIKAMELIPEIFRVAKESSKSVNEDILGCLEELVLENRIMEIEYVLPQMSYRIKSIYFPIGTTIKINNG